MKNQASTRLHERRLFAARAAWVLLALFTLATTFSFMPARFQQLVETCRQDAPALASLGLSTGFCVAIRLGFSLVAFLALEILAIFVFWRRSDDWVSLLASLTLVPIAATFSFFHALVPIPPPWRIPAEFIRALGAALFYVLLYLFPDGRFVPRWTRFLAVAALLYVITWLLFPGLPINIYNASTWPSGLLLGMAWIFAGILAQIYRFRYVSSPVQRQQSKWVIFGWILICPVLLAAYLPLSLFPALSQPGLPRMAYNLLADPAFQLALLFLNVCVAISIMRYKLFQIDILIRRTLIYSILTAWLALVYFSIVILFQAVLRVFPAPGEIGTVISTLSIAALFIPLRQRAQAAIDRRFYRHRYNAEQVLQNFGAAVRAEVDMNRLSERLMEIVEETMQPEIISLWLKPAAGKTKKN